MWVIFSPIDLPSLVVHFVLPLTSLPPHFISLFLAWPLPLPSPLSICLGKIIGKE